MEDENIICDSSKLLSTKNNDVIDSSKKTKKCVRFSKKIQVVFIPSRSENNYLKKNVTFNKTIIVYNIPNRKDILLRYDLWYTPTEIKHFEKEALKAYRIYLSKQNVTIIENE